jgi:hypothetical protein
MHGCTRAWTAKSRQTLSGLNSAYQITYVFEFTGVAERIWRWMHVPAHELNDDLEEGILSAA